MEERSIHTHRWFRVYTSFMLFLIALLLGALLVVFIITAVKVDNASNSITKAANNLNTSLKSIGSQLQNSGNLPGGLSLPAH